MSQVVSEEIINGAMVLGSIDVTQSLTPISEPTLVQSDKSSRWSSL